MTICSDCADLLRCCCYSGGRGEGVRISYTVADVARARQVIPGLRSYVHKLTDEEWAVASTVLNADLVYPHRLRIGLHDETGECGCMGEDGCRLDVTTRPRFCAVFPHQFYFRPDGLRALITCLHGPGCYGVQELKGNAEAVMAAMGTDKDSLSRLGTLYRDELIDQAAMSESEILLAVN